MRDHTRPLALGYLRVHLLMTSGELAAEKADLTTFATSEGFTLGVVFTEQAHTVPAAFQALLAAIVRDNARAVVVPTLRHLSVLGVPSTFKDHLERHTAARVLPARAT